MIYAMTNVIECKLVVVVQFFCKGLHIKDVVETKQGVSRASTDTVHVTDSLVKRQSRSSFDC